MCTDHRCPNWFQKGKTFARVCIGRAASESATAIHARAEAFYIISNDKLCIHIKIKTAMRMQVQSESMLFTYKC